MKYPKNLLNVTDIRKTPKFKTKIQIQVPFLQKIMIFFYKFRKKNMTKNKTKSQSCLVLLQKQDKTRPQASCFLRLVSHH